MGKIARGILLAMTLVSCPSWAALVGDTAEFPGYSGRDILMRRPGAITGTFWIDPDLPGGDAPFQVHVNNTSAGGGWTLAHDRNNTLPDLDAHPNAISILAVGQLANIRLVSSSFDAAFLGHYYQTLPLTGWAVFSGDPAVLSTLMGRAWNSLNFNQYSFFIKETQTVAYPESVPLPAAALLFASGLMAMGLGARRKKPVM